MQFTFNNGTGSFEHFAMFSQDPNPVSFTYTITENSDGSFSIVIDSDALANIYEKNSAITEISSITLVLTGSYKFEVAYTYNGSARTASLSQM